MNDRPYGPGRHDRGQLPVQPAQPLGGIPDGAHHLLEDDLLSRMREGLAGKPAPVRQRPMTAALVDPAVAQQEREQLLALAAQIVPRRLPRPHQIAHRLVHLVRHPDPAQLARTVQRARRT